MNFMRLYRARCRSIIFLMFTRKASFMFGLALASGRVLADGNPNLSNSLLPPTDISAACNDAIGADTKHSQAYQARGLAWYRMEEYDRAIDDFSQATKVNSKYTKVFYNQGFAWERKGKSENALADFQYPTELRLSNFGVQSAIVLVKSTNKKLEAKPEVNVVQQCPPDSSVSWTNCHGSYNWGAGKYVGDFKDGKPNGHGATYYGNDLYYEGEFKDNKFNGQGTIYAPDGSVRQTGLFKDGKFLEGSENAAPDSGAKVTPHGGTFHVPVTINGVITLNFTIDSGASDVSIPADVVSTLIRTESLVGSDFIGERKYVLADGSIVPSVTFNIRSLKVGNRVVQNVLGSLASAKGSLLLGQSFLGRFNSWSIDNKRQILILN